MLGFRCRLLAAVTAVKLLLVPSYYSTDFEVHRNWLAVTASLPLHRWYTDETSQWTLDYPPMFAWFERLLAAVGRFADPEMLGVANLDYASNATVWFQRCSVIVTDVVLVAAVPYVTAGQPQRRRDAAFALIVGSAGLLMVDHIHFQYNGLLIGLLVWSCALAEKQRDLAAAAFFSILLNMKHLFAAAGPVCFVYLLRHFCRGSHAVHGLLQLAAVTTAVFAMSFGPFAVGGQLRDVLARLFPFGRGLCHAYWAPNMWALYAAADRVLAACLSRLGLLTVQSNSSTMTGGLVGTADFTVLPQIGPSTTLALVLAAQVPCLVAVWRNPQPRAFTDAVVYSLLSAFVFGYHVHEKAILTVLIPVAWGALRSHAAASDFLFLCALGHHGLLPLLHEPREWPIKVAVAAAYFLAAHGLLKHTAGQGTTTLLSHWQRTFLWGLVPLELYCSFVHRRIAGHRLPFLPLMLTSVYCALGIVTLWCSTATRYVRHGSLHTAMHKQKSL